MEVALAREACYRAIGEAYFQEPVSTLANFSAWFQNELCGLLQVCVRQWGTGFLVQRQACCRH